MWRNRTRLSWRDIGPRLRENPRKIVSNKLELILTMSDWTVDEHLTAGGHSYFAEFVAGPRRCARRQGCRRTCGCPPGLGNRLREPRSKALEAGLFELRGTRVRIYYGFLPGRRAVLLGGYVKKRDDTPRNVLRLMRARLKEARK